MPQPKTPQAPQEREPGRSFHDRTRPLGEESLRRAQPTTAPTQENFSGRARQAARQADADRSGVAERAKVIGVLRKAEEFMSTANPPPDTDRDVRRALELACGRLGLTFAEYRALADPDPELVQLEREVIAEARRRWGAAQPPMPVVERPTPEQPEQQAARDEAEALQIFDRLFVPVDYTVECHRAVRIALDLRRTHGSKLCLFHAAESTGSDDWLGGIGSPSVGGDWVAESRARLRRFLAHIAPDAGEDIDVRSSVGLPLDTICREARSWGATLVVATASLHTRLVRSPAEKLLRELRLPVLIIPTDGQR